MVHAARSSVIAALIAGKADSTFKKCIANASIPLSTRKLCSVTIYQQNRWRDDHHLPPDMYEIRAEAYRQCSVERPQV